MKEIIFHASYKGSEKSQIEHWASLTPEERFEEFYSIMGRFYQFKERNWAEESIIIRQGANFNSND